ncbi:MAG: DUF2946 domain-containing protein [Mizugakiibacter sp.]|uniref:DUF2946 domain-containing protein n=1 Tax=Mizugakiibacter sp. TaxID=1972610 RepID=UPI0031C78994|nr:DUF2946 domain-containing protein [Xanthomonadaceae bacterium]
MIRSFRHRRVVAWLAFIAIALTAGAPVVSRLLPGAAMVPAAMAGCDMHHPGAHPAPAPDPHTPLDKCGYCSLFVHSPLLVAAVTPFLPIPAPPRFVAARRDLGRVPAHSPLAARPRGPPTFADA